MFSIGDKIIYFFLNEEDEETPIHGTVTDTFYEPGEMYQGLCMVSDDGVVYGGLCSSWCIKEKS